MLGEGPTDLMQIMPSAEADAKNWSLILKQTETKPIEGKWPVSLKISAFLVLRLNIPNVPSEQQYATQLESYE